MSAGGIVAMNDLQSLDSDLPEIETPRRDFAHRSCPCLPDRLFGTIDCQDETVFDASSDFTGNSPGTASDLQNAMPPRQWEGCDKV